MQLLVDTHILLWWLSDDTRLSTKCRSLLVSPSQEVYVSAASIWEAAIKQSIGKLCVDADLPAVVYDSGFRRLSITDTHAWLAGSLPPVHRDPFDRVLVAQAMHENLVILTDDAAIKKYPVATLS